MFDPSIEFPQLKNEIYLDHAGSAIPSKSMIDSWRLEISQTVYGNPHSKNSPAAAASTMRINHVRSRIKSNLSADHNYQVIFTKNTTHSLKLIAESIPWHNQSGHFCYLRESHTSVLGMREYLEHDRVHGIEFEDFKNGTALSDIVHDASDYNIFVFPAQCNFTGERFPLDWIKKVKDGCLSRIVQNKFPWLVVLDSASYLTTSTLSLKDYDADFVVFSFYKIFGFPTGVGALVAKTQALTRLKKTYYGGGTVDSIAWDIPWMVPRAIPEMFEDGTLPFLEILAIDHGFDFIDSIGGWKVVQEHVFGLAQFAKQEMNKIIIYTDQNNCLPLCEIYSGNDASKESSIIAFNIRINKTKYVGYNYVAKLGKFIAVILATLHGINLRGGVFCNPGAASKALDLSNNDIQRHHIVYHRRCGDEQDIIEGKPTGALRISFGISNTLKDVERWIDFLKMFFVPNQDGFTDDFVDRPVNGQLVNITIFPVKSCGGFSPNSWKIDLAGLSFDRHWMLIDDNGQTLTQKKCTNMALVRPINIDLKNNTVKFVSPNCMEELVLHKNEDSHSVLVDVCGSRSFSNIGFNRKYDEWFSEALGVSCHLVSCCYDRTSKLDGFPDSKISFANEAQFLCISKKSFEALNEKLLAQLKPQVDLKRFRANLVIDDTHLLPFEEENWLGNTLRIGDQYFFVTEMCERCSMICIDQNNGKKHGEPFLTLAKNSKHKSKINFGIFLQHDPLRSRKPYEIQIGSLMHLLKR